MISLQNYFSLIGELLCHESLHDIRDKRVLLTLMALASAAERAGMSKTHEAIEKAYSEALSEASLDFVPEHSPSNSILPFSSHKQPKKRSFGN